MMVEDDHGIIMILIVPCHLNSSILQLLEPHGSPYNEQYNNNLNTNQEKLIECLPLLSKLISGFLPIFGGIFGEKIASYFNSPILLKTYL